LKQVVERCALVRSAIEVWGDGSTLEEANAQAEAQFEETIRPYFLDEHSSANSWRVNFKRFGRAGDSGLSAREKQVVLEKFGDLLRKVKGSVDLQNPSHTFVLLEDWHNFHKDVVMTKYITRGYADTQVDLDNEFTPARVIFGIKLQDGPPIASKFELRLRPYIGTTAMDAVSVRH
jgi:hypothetical protein